LIAFSKSSSKFLFSTKFLISSSGLKALDLIQKRFIEKYYDIVDINIPTIEKIGGGSVRCMLLELY